MAADLKLVGAPEHPGVRVRVKDGRQIYRSPGPNPFRSGDVVELPADHAEALAASDHVEPELPPAAWAPATHSS